MNKKTVLIVDDEPHVIRVLKIALEREGYLVQAASDGAEALERLAQQELPDAMITDLQMPRAGGRALCERVRQQYPTQAFLILVMTSLTAIEEREWVEQLPNVEFLEKPLSPRRLVARLATYFSSNQCREVQHA